MRWVIRGVAVAIVVVSLVVAWRLLQPPQRSAVITEQWQDIGGAWLKANLRDAVMVIPDRPHRKEETRAGGDGLTRRRTYRVSTNTLRLRGPEIGPKPAGTKRILALGDSVTHGWGVTEEEAWPARLEAELRQRGAAVEVINAGVPANMIATMASWCTSQAGKLGVDLLLWTRRPPGGGFDDYATQVTRCATALRVPAIVLLPPVSTFDLHGSGVYRQEQEELSRRLAPRGIPVVDLTDTFRAAREGRGEVLERRGDTLAVVDQETGRVWLEAAVPQRDLPAEVYTLFEREPDVREALMFDEGHPDAEGFVVFGRAVADLVVDRVR
ncbi:MAG: SGNH/GDSL hydrolase family protein [Myxococcota bacterium]